MFCKNKIRLKTRLKPLRTYFCLVKQIEIIHAFVQLGNVMQNLGKNLSWQGFDLGCTEEEYLELQRVINKQIHYNGWFTKENVHLSLLNLGEQLHQEALSKFVAPYNFSNEPKRVAIIMAGNIPLVGFHDFLCVLISGNVALCKLSSNDSMLLPALSKILVNFLPELASRIEFSTGKLTNIEAVIATGSDNSLKFFNQYFGHLPHIFRKNRTSVAVIDGSESDEELNALGKDIFTYYGLGCRNVSHLFVPQHFELDKIFKNLLSYGDIIHHNKYANNYDYNKAVYLLNKENLLDNNFVLLRKSDQLFSPLAMVHYQEYKDVKEVENYLKEHQDQIQVVVGKHYTPFGSAQCPTLTDFADGVDTMQFLQGLN